MAFTIASAPHGHSRQSTSAMMRWVLLALLPGLVAQIWFFGYGVLVQLLLASITALLAESLVLMLRRRPVWSHLRDSSALLTAALIAVSIPPLLPWYLVVIGTVFAIIIGKQLYGGLGQNPFNPAMLAYVLLLVSFPGQMTSWLPPAGLTSQVATFPQAARAVLEPGSGLASQWQKDIDGTTSATPLDSMKTQLKMGKTVSDVRQQPQYTEYGGIGWKQINLAFLGGGVFLLLIGTIAWQIPTAMLLSLAACSALAWQLDPLHFMPPVLELLSGATMLGAFFIATDPVTASTTPRGRLIYGALIGVLIFIIRSWGGYPDGVAFSVLLINILVPLIDHVSRPRIYGQ